MREVKKSAPRIDPQTRPIGSALGLTPDQLRAAAQVVRTHVDREAARLRKAAPPPESAAERPR